MRSNAVHNEKALKKEEEQEEGKGGIVKTKQGALVLVGAHLSCLHVVIAKSAVLLLHAGVRSDREKMWSAHLPRGIHDVQHACLVVELDLLAVGVLNRWVVLRKTHEK